MSEFEHALVAIVGAFGVGLAVVAVSLLYRAPVSNFTFDDQRARNYICSFAVCATPTPEAAR